MKKGNFIRRVRRCFKRELREMIYGGDFHADMGASEKAKLYKIFLAGWIGALADMRRDK